MLSFSAYGNSTSGPSIHLPYASSKTFDAVQLTLLLNGHVHLSSIYKLDIAEGIERAFSERYIYCERATLMRCFISQTKLNNINI